MVLGIVLSPTVALIVAAIVVVGIILAWKALKLAFKIAVIAAGILVILFVLNAAGILDVPLPFIGLVG